MSDRYDDIIGLPHYVSATRIAIPLEKRAAQFAPFAALTGHNEAITETARLTTHKSELSEDECALLSYKLNILLNINPTPVVTVTYFVADRLKEGGRLESVTGRIKSLEPALDLIVFENRTELLLSAVTSIDCEEYNQFE